jgi:hypothetical protein
MQYLNQNKTGYPTNRKTQETLIIMPITVTVRVVKSPERKKMCLWLDAPAAFDDVGGSTPSIFVEDGPADPEAVPVPPEVGEGGNVEVRR